MIPSESDVFDRNLIVGSRFQCRTMMYQPLAVFRVICKLVVARETVVFG